MLVLSGYLSLENEGEDSRRSRSLSFETNSCSDHQNTYVSRDGLAFTSLRSSDSVKICVDQLLFQL